MAIADRFNVISLAAASLLLILPVAYGAQQRPPIAERIAKAYGLEVFGQIEAIRYTFSIPELSVSRSWVWEPKTDTVSYDGPDKQGQPLKVTYLRDQLSSQGDAIKNDIDPAFINDHYVLLFPLHVAWDTWTTVSDEGMHETPIGKMSATRVVVKFPSEGGYSPGDTWELYVGKNKRITEFVYHRAGAGWPKVYTATWEGYERAGPLLLATVRDGTTDEGKHVRVLYTNVAVKLKGSENWIDAR